VVRPRSQIPGEVEVVLEDKQAEMLTATSKPFWFMVAALKGFMECEGGGKLPLSGQVW
jgi:amyloid beta precursor protein binding protein 1